MKTKEDVDVGPGSSLFAVEIFQGDSLSGCCLDYWSFDVDGVIELRFKFEHDFVVGRSSLHHRLPVVDWSMEAQNQISSTFLATLFPFWHSGEHDFVALIQILHHPKNHPTKTS